MGGRPPYPGCPEVWSGNYQPAPRPSGTVSCLQCKKEITWGKAARCPRWFEKAEEINVAVCKDCYFSYRNKLYQYYEKINGKPPKMPENLENSIDGLGGVGVFPNKVNLL